MKVQEAMEAMQRRRKVKQRITDIEGRIVEHYRGNVFLIESFGIRSRAKAGDLSLTRRKSSDGKTK